MAEIPATSISLLKDLASGTKNARWAEFVRIYEQPMRAFLRARFQSVDEDDVMQETMVAVTRSIPDYHYTPDVHGHFRNYLFGILSHKAKDAVRKQVREADKRERAKSCSAACTPRSDDAEYEEWKLAAMNAALDQMLSDETVNSRSREIFRHVALLHEPPADVAQAFGVSRANVDKIKSRLVQRLAELVRTMTESAF